MLNHTVYFLVTFLLLGMGLGYALGSARTAKKFAMAAKVESHEASIKVDTLEIKVDKGVVIRNQALDDMTDRMDATKVSRDQEMSDMSDRIDDHHPEES